MIRIEEIGLEIHDVVDGALARLDDLLDVYLDLFPEYARYIAVMRRRANRPPNATRPFIEHQWLALIDGRPAGLVVFKYNYKRNCGLGLDLGVRPDFRKTKATYQGQTRLAKILIDLRHEQIARDAFSFGNPLPLGVLVEVESPKVVARFMEYGMQLLPIEYFEPPVTEDAFELVNLDEIEKTGFKPMHLGAYPIDRGEFNLEDPVQISRFIKALLIDHYGLLETHWAVRQALQSISRSA
ncbi:MAG: hypothetical protein PHQ36_14460 [Anaerolineales bacterium]|nr:hypothetical protein [Anaerolineales bacterium]